MLPSPERSSPAFTTASRRLLAWLRKISFAATGQGVLTLRSQDAGVAVLPFQMAVAGSYPAGNSSGNGGKSSGGQEQAEMPK